MAVSEVVAADAPARVLALIVSGDGPVSTRAMRLLGDLGAFEQIGVDRDRFIELARDGNRRLAPGLCDRSWLSDDDIAHADALLDAVGTPDDRKRVCRLAALTVKDDDGLVTHGARLMLDHVLAHWRIDQATL